MTSAILRDLQRYRRATELYAVGREVPLKGGAVIWLQAMNSLERDEAVADAQSAQARVSLALKDEDSEERLKVKIMFTTDGVEGSAKRLREAHQSEAYVEVIDEMDADEDWTERIAMIRRGNSMMTAPTSEEREFLRKTLLDFTDEFEKRMTQVLDGEEARLAQMDEDDRFDEYLQWWAGMRGNEVGLVEYRFTECFYAARACAGVEVDGRWDHSACEQHRVKVFDSKDDLRHEPFEFLDLLFGVLAEMEVSEREAKLLAAQSSFSESSASRSSAAESTPSTQTETSPEPPGTSSPPSPTP